MRRIGLDFGTTNSILACCEGDHVRPFRLAGAHSQDYIPSEIAYERATGEIAVGRAARSQRGDPDFHYLRLFKPLLGGDAGWAGDLGYTAERTPARVTEDYLRHLVQAYQAQAANGAVEELVLTVPEAWVKEGHHAARERLRQIGAGLGAGAVRLLSEPVAAAAYYVHLHRQRRGRPFEGHVFVCDYGGGTLDMSLVAVREDRIVVVGGTGRGNGPSDLGHGGVAYDEAVVQRVHQQATGRRLSRSEGALAELAGDFEEKKITQHDRVEKALDRYLKLREQADGGEAEAPKIFGIGAAGLPVTAVELVEVFEALVQSQLAQALAGMDPVLAGVDTASRERFRVVLVGGFSSFPLVRRHIRAFFGAALATDPRFALEMSLEDTALAIAKGAALVAAGKVQVLPTAPIGIGIRLLAFAEGDQEVPVARWEVFRLIVRGEPVTDCHAPRFLERPVRVGGSVDESLQIVVDEGSESFPLEVGRPLRDFLPNAGDRGNTWRVGVSVDDDLTFHFHAVDAAGEARRTSLGHLMPRGFRAV